MKRTLTLPFVLDFPSHLCSAGQSQELSLPCPLEQLLFPAHRTLANPSKQAALPLSQQWGACSLGCSLPKRAECPECQGPPSFTRTGPQRGRPGAQSDSGAQGSLWGNITSTQGLWCLLWSLGASSSSPLRPHPGAHTGMLTWSKMSWLNVGKTSY